MSWAFLLTAFVIVATPGTGAVLTIAAGLRFGTRQAIITALGCTLGIVPHLVAAISGTAVLLRAGGAAFEIMRIAGVLYLLFMAWNTWRDRGMLSIEEEPQAPPSLGMAIWVAVLANLLNPKLTIFFFAFLPQFVSPDSPTAVWSMVGLASVFMAMTFVVFSAYGWFATAMRRHLIDRPRVVRWVQRTFSMAYVALGAKLATERH